MSQNFTQSSEALALIAAACVALLISYFLSLVSVWRGFMPDEPNERSSHSRITPRSGGVAIMGAWLAGMAVVAVYTRAATPPILTLAALAVCAFAFGFFDDRYQLSPRFKFAGQAACGFFFAAVFGPLQSIPVPFMGELDLGIAATAVTVIWIIGFMNAYNFMDGVNGLAAGSALIALCAFAVAAMGLGAGVYAMAALTLSFALGGFLRLNFPDGRIFMGDGGSQSVGFLIAALAVLAANRTGGVVSFLFLPTAMAPFLFDVAFTLVHRWRRGQPLLSAHREHLYQLLLRQGLTHGQVTGVYAALIVVSSVVAALMLRLTPTMQWFAPIGLILLYLPPAGMVLFRAYELGLLAPPSADKTAAKDQESSDAEDAPDLVDHSVQPAAE